MTQMELPLTQGAKVRNWFKSATSKLWVAGFAVFAVIIACFRAFFLGRAEGAAEATADADKKRVREAAEKGDDDAVLKEWRRRP